MLNASGYVMTNTMAKAQNNAYYVSDSKGRIITKKLVKYKGSRYYFGGNGQRVSWKNCWHGCRVHPTRFIISEAQQEKLLKNMAGRR